MSSALLLVLSAWAVLIDYGWQPTGGGGLEYIIQVQPDLIDDFRAQGFSSEIPPQVQDIRRIRIVVGDKQLPREGATDIGGESSKGGEKRTARYVADTSASGNSGDSSETSQPILLGLDELRLTQIGLALAIAAVLFLIFVHMGTRARYRELLRQSHT
jgi:hypothetical protein